MAPGYRANVTNRRQHRTGQVDHGEFDGLPVRHWRRDYVTVAPPTNQDNQNAHGDIWAVELPLGMPKDAHLIPQHCQDLLRAARSGKIYKRPVPIEEEEVDPEAIPNDKPEKKEEYPKDKGFMAKAWKQIPRHQEGPDIGYLAKRRKGLFTVSARPNQGPIMTKTTVRRTDAAGNEYVQDIIVAPGQAVEGEIISQTPLGADGALLATPPRRKGPISQKKKKGGPGRGKKKILEAPTSAPQVSKAEGAPTDSGTKPIQDGVKVEDESEATPAMKADAEMVDDSNANSDDDDAEEGEIEEDDDRTPKSSDSPSKTQKPRSPPSSSTTITKTSTVELPDVTMTHSMSEETAMKLPVKETKSSPLDNMPSKASRSASPVKAPMPTAKPSQDVALDDGQGFITSEALDLIAEPGSLVTAGPTDLPPPPPAPTAEAPSVEMRQEEEEEDVMLLDAVDNTTGIRAGEQEDEMLLDAVDNTTGIRAGEQEDEMLLNIVEDTNSAQEGNSSVLAPVAVATRDSTLPPPPASLPAKPPTPMTRGQSASVTARADTVTSVQQAAQVEDDPFDLLGGLERSLHKVPSPVKAVGTAESIEKGLTSPVKSPAVKKVEAQDADVVFQEEDIA